MSYLLNSFTHLETNSFLFSNFVDILSRFILKTQKRLSFLLHNSWILSFHWLQIVPILFLLSLPFAPDSTLQVSSIDSNTLDQVSVNQRQFGIALFSPTNLLLLPLFGCWIFKLSTIKPKFFSYDLFLALFVVTAIFSTILSINNSASFVWMLKLSLGVFIYLVFSTYFFKPQQIYHLFYAICGIVFFEFLIVLGQYINNGYLGTLFENENKIALDRILYTAGSKFTYFRNVGSFSHPNMLAAFLAITLPISIFFLFTKRKLLKLLGLSTFLFSFSMIFLTLSRSGVITALAAIFLMMFGFFYYLPSIRRELFKWSKILFLLILFIFILTILNPFIEFRFLNITLEDQSLLTRLELNQIAFSTIRHSPLFGIGGGTFPIYLANFDTSRGDLSSNHLYNIHNFYLTLLTENGNIVTTLFLVTICLIFVFFLKRITGYSEDEKKIAITLMAITILFFINGFFEPRSFSDRIGFFFWLFLGLFTNLLRYTKTSPIAKLSQVSHSFFFILISSSAFISFFRRFLSKWLLPH